MTKRERFSFALRRLRNVKDQANIARRIQETHEIVKEMIDELSKGTKNADLAQHTTQLLDELYAQNTGAIEDGRLPAPDVMPDCAEQIHAQTQALQAITSDDAATRRSETADVLHHTLSLFAQGPNAEPIETFLSTLKDRVQWANALPTPMPDCTKQIQVQTDALSNPDSSDDPTQARDSAVSTLCHTLSVFAQGPNAEPIETLLETFNDRIMSVNALPTPMPDCTELIQVQTHALSNLNGTSDPTEARESAVSTLCHTLSVFAQGPNEEPIEQFLDTFNDRIKWVNTLPPPMPDCAEHIQLQTDTLSTLDGIDNGPQLLEALVHSLRHTLSVFAQGPNELPVQTLMDRVKQTMERASTLPPLMPDYSTHLQSDIDWLEELVQQDDAESIEDMEITVLRRALLAFAQGPNEEPIQTLVAMVEQLRKQKELYSLLPDHTEQLQSQTEALAALEGLDDPDALTAAAAITLYETLAGMAHGAHEAPIQALLDTFDRVTGAV